MPQRLPNFFVLGVQKCGTTTIADAINTHPAAFIPSIKETYFFCVDKQYRQGLDAYWAEFFSAVSQRHLAVGEATPFYLCSQAALDRIAAATQGRDCRYIVSLRDPVKRAYSAYWHQRRLGTELLEFDEALAAEPRRIAEQNAQGGRWWRHAYVEVGCYAGQLQYAFDRLGRDRFLILLEEDLRDVAALNKRLASYLRLPDAGIHLSAPARSNAAAMPRFGALHRLVTSNNAAKRLVARMVPRELRTRIGRSILKANQRAFAYPRISDRAFDRLRERFLPEVDALRKLIDRPLESWLQH